MFLDQAGGFLAGHLLDEGLISRALQDDRRYLPAIDQAGPGVQDRLSLSDQPAHFETVFAFLFRCGLAWALFATIHGHAEDWAMAYIGHSSMAQLLTVESPCRPGGRSD
jgi:hypothetical protein